MRRRHSVGEHVLGGGKSRTIKGRVTLNTAEDIPTLVTELTETIKEHGKEVHVHWWVD